uniref:20S-pre-rRNA D-site endonuclease NOB1 n=1 Tax=Eutreptiella gymnastica TaxID=73025 RepID=A0A7S4CVP1_9EUGL
MDVSLAKDLQYLVIDTNAIIAGGNFWQKAPKVVTTDEVLTEVKDKKSATFLRDLPVTIEVENPDADSILMIMKVARELGDYGSLSKADIKVLALAYQYSRTYDTGFKHYQDAKSGAEASKPGVEDDRKVYATMEPGQPATGPASAPVAAWGKHVEPGLSFADMLRRKAAPQTVTPAAGASGELGSADGDAKPGPAAAPVNPGESESNVGTVPPDGDASTKQSGSGETTAGDEAAGVNGNQNAKEQLSEPQAPDAVPIEQVVAAEEHKTPVVDDVEDDLLAPVSTEHVLAAAEDIDEEEEEDEDDEYEEEEEWEEEDEEEEDFGGSDGEGEWITPDNVREMNLKDMGTEADEEEDTPRPVALLTTDFPMQNVAMYLGINLLAMNGLKVRWVKKWILRCHGCYTLVTDTTRQFCPQCGSGDTLKKVSYTVNDKGETKLYINPKHVIKIKHTKMYLHKPRGGKCGTNKTLVLREDQLRNCGRTYNRDKEDRKLAALWDEEWAFANVKGTEKRVTHMKAKESFFQTHKRGLVIRKKG